jgi:hypothetical protein
MFPKLDPYSLPIESLPSDRVEVPFNPREFGDRDGKGLTIRTTNAQKSARMYWDVAASKLKVDYGGTTYTIGP